MCGIAGLVERTPRAGDGVIGPMLGRLARRGPDGEGRWHGERDGWHVTLGHRRLAIIDVAGGHQPMDDGEGRMHLTFNGEIYNFMTLRADLESLGHRFRTRSDTEVIVHAVREWGARAVERLNGMFAFAAWNAQTGELLLARDRAGVKPLYYAQLPGGGLVFGSELTAVLEHPDVPRVLSSHGLSSYFFSDYAHPPWTLVEGVRKLAPGELVVWKDGVLGEPRRYWQLALGTRGDDADPGALPSELWRRLGDAVERQLVSDVPVGVFLSGGIDSSAITILAHERYPSRLKTFSIGFEDAAFDESAYAREVAQKYGTEHVEERIGEQTMLGVIDEVLDRLDEPVADHSILPTYLLSALAARHVKVVLGGDGGDELFGGYPTYRAHGLARWIRAVPKRVRHDLMPKLVARLPSQAGYQRLDWKLKRFFGRWDDDMLVRHLRWMSNVDLPELARALPASGAGQPAALGERVPASDDEVGRLLALDFMTYMPGSVLTKVDRATMAHGLESRPPMLDNEIIDWAFSLSSSVKMRGGEPKAILKAAVAPMLPEKLVRRRKQGFSVPLAEWLRGPLAPRLDRVLEASPLWHPRALDREVFRGYRSAHAAKRGDHAKTLWALLVLDAWVKRERIDVG